MKKWFGYLNSNKNRDTSGGSTVEILPTGIAQPNLVSEYSIDYSSIPGEVSEIERVIAVAIQDATNDVKISYELGWITKKFFKDILVIKLEAAKRLEE